MITREQIARLKELEEKATKGPWKRINFDIQTSTDVHLLNAIPDRNPVSNAKLIAESRNILPALLRDYEKLLEVYEAATDHACADVENYQCGLCEALKACEEGEK